MMDERTERLINRKLDGELTAAESLELDKLLIRNPQARALFEEYAAMDAQASELLRAVVAPSVTAGTTDRMSETAWNPPPRRWWYSFGLVSGLAAAITLAVLLSHRAATVNVTSPADVSGAMVVSGGPSPARPDTMTTGPTNLVSHVEGPRRETTNLERDVIGWWDRESGSLYLIEADRARSIIELVRVNY